MDGFWSISVYNAKGFFEKNALNAYSLNNLTAKPDPGGGHTIQFGSCEANAELPADRDGLELHRAALSAAQGNSRWKLEAARGAAGAVTGTDRGRRAN